MADGRTEDGYGIEFGVNHLGHFLLTCLLLERMKKAEGARIITLASMAYRWGHVDFEVSFRIDEVSMRPFIIYLTQIFNVTLALKPCT